MPDLAFHPAVARWLAQTFGTPTEPQQRGWPAIQTGAHTLIAAPTGSGKTLAAFLASLDQLFREGMNSPLPDETRVVYVSPLKALSNDIHKNLEEPLAGIRAILRADGLSDVEIRTAVRTGDTPAAARQALARRPPHILVTTPESLYLLLTSQSGRRMLRTVRTLIVDEIHAVVSSRRGSHLALSMERLSALVSGPLQRIGLSATQKPMDEVARFLVGARYVDRRGRARCTVVDCGYRRDLDVAIELPGSPLEAVMSNEVWSEVYGRLAALIEAHRTTLVFVNTRRLAERVTYQLESKLGKGRVMAHHGSLARELRLEAEDRLKRGELRALVATASLELGIDIGSVDLVCQIGATRSISALLQRVGRAEHRRGGRPRGRLFPLSRDELVECIALLRAIREGELDALEMPRKPLDLLAQQIVAAAAVEDWDEDQLFELMRSAWPYRDLARDEFDAVVRMLADGFSTKRGRRGALIHHDAINHRIRGRRGARLLAQTSGGAIPDNSDYRVVVEPAQTFIGTVNEDFAVESMTGDIFQLGNSSWKILQVNSGTVRVEDAHGQPPGIPFWLGEAPARSPELSAAVSSFRIAAERTIGNRAAAGDVPASSPAAPVGAAAAGLGVLPEKRESDGPTPQHETRAVAAASLEDALVAWLADEPGLPSNGARQLASYFAAIHRSLGAIPSQRTLVLERFFDASGGMQLVLHSPFGSRVNRAWGLALRKRFCRSFNFELQAAATDDAIVISLGTQHSFPLEEVFHYLNRKSVRDLLVQALLDAPMFPIRWRWNASRSLALPRQRGGRKVPAPLQRMESENLLAAVFPDQLACPENLVGDRVVPDHPLVRQTIDDCLEEAMDLPGLLEVLRRIEDGTIRCIARDLPEPSPLAHEILNAKPYAFLDNAPLEERRTQAVYLRRASEISTADELGALDPAAITTVCAEAWPQAANADELHEALLLVGALTEAEVRRTTGGSTEWLELLVRERRVRRLPSAPAFWVAAERWRMLQAVYSLGPAPAPVPEPDRVWERSEAVRELARGRIEVSGPVTAAELAEHFLVPPSEITGALLALEGEGFVLRGRFRPDVPEVEWCDRRLLARIHRLTINRLRAEIQPVTIAVFQRFLLAWQRVDSEHRAEGPEGVRAVLELFDGYEVPAAAWEPEVLALRVKDYTPAWLDQLCFTGRIGWGRLTAPQNASGRVLAPMRSSPIALFDRDHLAHWLALARPRETLALSTDARHLLETLERHGALFFGELVRHTGLLPTRVEQALAELVAQGRVTADSYEGLRALLLPEEKRARHGSAGRAPRRRPVSSIEFAGRWSALRAAVPVEAAPASNLPGKVARPPDAPKPSPEASPVSTMYEQTEIREAAVGAFARALLRRNGVVFRRLLERESIQVPWFELVRVFRRLEARGEIRGGHFVSGVSGEQFALPEAVGLLRSVRREEASGKVVTISAADPLNLAGILTPGPRIAAIATHRILLRDGVPIAALRAGELINLEDGTAKPDAAIERALRVGSVPPALRPYYA